MRVGPSEASTPSRGARLCGPQIASSARAGPGYLPIPARVPDPQNAVNAALAPHAEQTQGGGLKLCSSTPGNPDRRNSQLFSPISIEFN
jgi:hypothetical protein